MSEEIFIIKGEDIICAICLESWAKKDARTLPCHHTFCFDCLKRLIVRSRMECPLCRKIYRYNENEIESIQKNYLQSIIKDQSEFTDWVIICLFFNIFIF